MPDNVHASVVVLGDRGVMIAGRSGSGKSTLVLALIETVRRAGLFARLVCDDQAFVTASGGRVVAWAPQSIRGLAEVYGVGPTPMPSEPCAVIDLLVRLGEASEAPRFATHLTEEIAGTSVALLQLTERNTGAAAAAIRAKLLI